VKVTPRAVMSSTLVRPVCGGGELVRSEVGSEIIMRPSSLGGGRILRRTLSVRLSVCLSVRPVIVIRRAT